MFCINQLLIWFKVRANLPNTKFLAQKIPCTDDWGASAPCYATEYTYDAISRQLDAMLKCAWLYLPRWEKPLLLNPKIYMHDLYTKFKNSVWGWFYPLPTEYPENHATAHDTFTRVPTLFPKNFPLLSNPWSPRIIFHDRATSRSSASFFSQTWLRLMAWQIRLCARL